MSQHAYVDFVNDPKRHYNDKIITLEWALGYERAKNIHDKMWKEKVYISDNAKKEIADAIKANGFFIKHRATPFGDLSQPMDQLNLNGQFYIQSDTVGSAWNSATSHWDDMHAALANFTFRMAVEGEVIHKGR